MRVDKKIRRIYYNRKCRNTLKGPDFSEILNLSPQNLMQALFEKILQSWNPKPKTLELLGHSIISMSASYHIILHSSVYLSLM